MTIDKPTTLHCVYLKQAILHLKALDSSIKKFNGMANTHMLNVATVIDESRKKLIRENKIYAEAWKFLKEMNEVEEKFR